MNDIYAVRNDGIKYRELDLGILDVTRHTPDNVSFDDVLEFSLTNLAMKSWWMTPETEFYVREENPNAPIPDICAWIDSTLLLSGKAFRFLKDLLQNSGEFLPVIVEKETYYIFNCFVNGEADEDKVKYEYAGDVKLGVTHLKFKKSAEELLVFKSIVDYCTTLYCGERFKTAVETFGLEGLMFDKI